MINRIDEVDKMNRAGYLVILNVKCFFPASSAWPNYSNYYQANPEEKKMIYTFLDAFITKTKLQALM